MKVKATIIILIISLQAIAGWEPFSQGGIEANKIIFYVDINNTWVVCHEDGLCHYNLNTQEWTNINCSYPNKDAAWLDGGDFLVILNDYEYLDGVHSFNIWTGMYTLIKNMPNPNFIAFDEELDKYFIGHHSGMEYSLDGLAWYEIPYFHTIKIVDMEISGSHYVACRSAQISDVHYSDDAGASWTISPGAPVISDLEFDNTGKLYGVFPGNSYSSGLWSSNDYGATWNVEFWATGINCVGLDAAGSVFVGFGEDAQPPNKGVARWDSLNQQLYYLNTGLPNLNINQITYNQAMSAPAIFCCTDTGVYINYDYVDIDETQLPSSTFKLWPNPANDQLNIHHDMEGIVNISIYSAGGKIIDRFSGSYTEKEINYNCSGLDPGLYILNIENTSGSQSLKWIKK